MDASAFPRLIRKGAFSSPSSSVSPQGAELMDTSEALTCPLNAWWPWPHLRHLSLRHSSHLSSCTLIVQP